ncbi:MAG: GNAT family acetyltransferase [Euryarchaeota archaeon]|nr:GNAT family acetyltransferase [Euryarchaeota archaeon]
MIWAINEEGLPGTGKVSQQEIKALLEFSSLSIGAYLEDRLVGFVICLPPNTEYGSLNYAWFNQRYDKFLYVDRIAVSVESQNQNIGSILYEHVKKQAEEMGVLVAAEVNIYPPNPGSMRFHDRHGFEQVGVLDHDEKSVALFVYNSNEGK